MISIETATPELLTRYYGAAPVRSVRAIVAVEDGEPIAVAGMYVDYDKAVIFSDKRKPVSKRVIAKAYRRVLMMVQHMTVPVFASADPGIDGACTLLMHMGFTHFQGDVWVNLQSL